MDSNVKLEVIQSDANLSYSERLVKSFILGHEYLKPSELRFPSEQSFCTWLNPTILKEYHKEAFLRDERTFTNLSKDNIPKLVLPDKFFQYNESVQLEILVHEMGHFFTNPKLNRERNFESKFNPVSINSDLDKPVVQNYNKGIYILFDITKLIQEIETELWGKEHHQEISFNRLNSGTKNNLSFNFSESPIKPCLNLVDLIQDYYLMLWYEIISRCTNYDLEINVSGRIKDYLSHLNNTAEEYSINFKPFLSEYSKIVNAALNRDLISLAKSFFLLLEVYIMDYNPFPESYGKAIRSGILQYLDNAHKIIDDPSK